MSNKRSLFHIGEPETWPDDGIYYYITLPAEIITHEIDIYLDNLSRWGAEDEQNLKDGMWHWHWTVNETRLSEVRTFLAKQKLTETSDLNTVW